RGPRESCGPRSQPRWAACTVSRGGVHGVISCGRRGRSSAMGGLRRASLFSWVRTPSSLPCGGAAGGVGGRGGGRARRAPGASAAASGGVGGGGLRAVHGEGGLAGREIRLPGGEGLRGAGAGLEADLPGAVVGGDLCGDGLVARV